MSQAPSMPMYWDAYIADTTHLTIEEHGAYLLLLGAMWRRNGEVPDDDKDNARILGLSPQKWRKIKERLVETIPGFYADGNTITQKKLKKVWENTQEKIETNRANGAKGGRPKTSKNKDITKANGSVSDKRIKTIPEPEPEPEPKEGVNPLTPFSEFWAKWPNKTAKKNAEVAWKRLSQPDREVILSLPSAGFEAWRRQCPNANPIHPASFLNGRRWEDEPMKGTVNGTTPNDSGADVARRAAERWAARRMDSGPGANASQPLLSARQSDGRSGSGNR